jgi:hydroxyacylglutathione hydrolase
MPADSLRGQILLLTLNRFFFLRKICYSKELSLYNGGLMAGAKRKVEKLNDDVWIIRFGFVSMYVYARGDAAFCIDTGFGARGCIEGLRACNIKPEAVKAIFLTHTDMDHTGGLSALGNAALYLAAEERQMIDGTTPRFFGLIKNRITRTDYTLLKDEDVIRIAGAEIRCILTPGHTPGSMSFLVNGRYLFAGDIFNFKRGRVVMDRGFIMMNKAKQRESIRRLARLDGISLLACAHSGYTKDATIAFEEWRDG